MRKKNKRPVKAPKKPVQHGVGQGVGGGAPEGNKHAERFPDSAARREAFRLYCLHIAAGYSGGSFYEPCVEDTINNLKKKYPEDFPDEPLQQARAKGRMFWEAVGKEGTIGKIKGFNSHAWKFNMQNRLGWKDKIETGLDAGMRAVFKMKMGKPLEPRTDEE